MHSNHHTCIRYYYNTPYSVKHFPNKKIDCGVFDNLRLPPLLSKSTEKTRNDFKFNITRRLLTLTPAQCHEVSARPFTSKVTSSLKGISSAGLLENFLPHWESGGCCQSSRASRKILLVSLEGCDRVTDIDCTECTCSGQVVRQQVVVIVLVRYGQRSIKK